MKMRQDTINKQFEQQHLSFIEQDVEKAVKLVINILLKAAEMADEFNERGAPDGQRMRVHRAINHELYEAEKAIELLPKKDARRKKLVAVRREMLTMPFASSEKVYALKNEFFGVKSYVPTEKPTFQGEDLKNLVQQQLL